MGKITTEITRDNAIDRIKHINSLAADGNYREISVSCAPEDDDADALKQFVDSFQRFDVEKYSNSMLEKLMNSRFYRVNSFEFWKVVEASESE